MEEKIKHSVIDVGSNTIRMVIYNIDGKNLEEVAHERDFAGLITYVSDGILSDGGKNRIISTLTKMSDVCKRENCENISCFATASLRNVKNIDSVTDEILNKTGIKMSIISGEDEARYDFFGLISEICEKNGVGFDLGGGSCQLFKFSEGELKFFKSLKIGGQVIYKKFVSDVLPDKDEMQNIYDYILSELSPLEELKNAGGATVYAMGGAARNAAKYELVTKNINSPFRGFILSKERLVEICRKITHTSEGRQNLTEIIPDRLTTLIPGIITIIAILDFTGSDKIQIVTNGVREGFVYENIISKNGGGIKNG